MDEDARLPVEGSFGDKFSSICNHCGVMASGSHKVAKICIVWRIWRKTTPYAETFKILFLYDSSRHRSTSCVQISWNLEVGKSVKSCVAYMTKKNKILLSSPGRATASIEPKICQSQSTRMYPESSRFHLNRLTFGGVILERVNTIKMGCKLFPVFGWSLALSRITKREKATRKIQTRTIQNYSQSRPTQTSS